MTNICERKLFSNPSDDERCNDEPPPPGHTYCERCRCLVLNSLNAEIYRLNRKLEILVQRKNSLSVKGTEP